MELHISDGQGGITQLNFTLAVVSQPQNQTPLINTTPNSFNATVGQTYTYNPTASDPDGHQLLWQLINAPDGMSVNPQTGTLRWTPTTDQLGDHQIDLQVINTQGASRGQTFTLTVRGVNLAPLITTNPNTTATIGQLYQYQLNATDPEGQPLTYALQTRPDGLTLNQQTGLLQWTPSNNQKGNHTITIAIKDNLGATTEHSYTLVVFDPDILKEDPATTPIPTSLNQPPIITSKPIFGGTVGETYTYTVTAIDPDGDNSNLTNLENNKANQTNSNHLNLETNNNLNENTITFQLLISPEGMTIDGNTGQNELHLAASLS